MTKRTFTDTERKEWKEQKHLEIRDLSARLQASVAAIQSSEDFTRWLNVQARFHRYSYRNSMLILLQCPDATHIAGFGAWQRIGRAVRKGETGIRIFAPSPFAVERTDQKTGETGEQVIQGFKAVSVFDIAQTDGKPVPTLILADIAGNEGSTAYTALCEYATSLDVTVEDGSPDDTAHGTCHYHERRIVIRPADANRRLATLAHELAHYLTRERRAEWGKAERETVAEGVAYIVMQQMDIDTSGFSFAYIAGWVAHKNGAEIIQYLMETIQQTAHALISAIEERNPHLVGTDMAD